MDKNEILAWAKENNYIDIEYVGKYKEYEAWYLIYSKEPVCIGFPLCALVKDSKIRISTPEESLEIIAIRDNK